MKIITWLKPTALQIAVRDMEAAKADRLTAAKNREYYASMETMLAGRIERLRRDIRSMNQEMQDGQEA